MNQKFIDIFASFKDYFGDKLILDTEAYPQYSKDASEISLRPAAIFFAETEQDVIEIINKCRVENIPIVFRGAGTGYTGGAVPVPNGLVLALERLRHLEVDHDRRIAICGPGIITIELMNEAEKYGLYYPPDPASYDESALGGNVAENAGGLHCKKYGVTKDYIIGLKAVTIDGELIKTGYFSDGELFDLAGLLIGSEGLLGAVTEIAVRLIKQPQYGPTILAAFDMPENAAATVAEIIRRGIVPSVMEYMDGDAVECSNKYEKSVDIGTAAAVLLLETSGDNRQSEANEILSICRQFNASSLLFETDKSRTESLWKIRRNLSKAVKASVKFKIAEDVCVPPSKLPRLVEFVSELNKKYPMRVNSYGHAGDGNLHVNFLTDEIKYIENGLIEEGTVALFKKTVELGGTLTGEHGIGLTKKDHLGLEFSPETIEAMKAVKSAFDGKNLLNPGKMFPDQ